MKAFEKLEHIQSNNNSILSIGLDTDLMKIPEFLRDDLNGIYSFNCSIIEATSDIVSAYKINFAFYEQYGWRGIEILQKTKNYIPSHIFTIADAKRSDIGNTSRAYAASIFKELEFDSVTLCPYIGVDTILPFLEFNDKMVFVLALTSNPSSNDFQNLIIDGEPLYIKVIRKMNEISNEEILGFVVGATHPDDIYKIREVAPFNYLLVPGIGAQGGSPEKVLQANKNRNIIINVSRDIIYYDKTENFAELARQRAEYYRDLFNSINFNLIKNNSL